MWALLLLPAIGVVVASADAERRGGPDLETLTARVNAELGLSSHTIVRLDLERVTGVALFTDVLLGGEVYTLEMAPLSVRSDASWCVV